MKLIIHSDGGSRGNPGPSAIGFVIKDPIGKTVHSEGKQIGIQTNNVAEYIAIYMSILRAKELGGKDITIYVDSELAQRQITGAYKIKDRKLLKIYNKIKEEIKQFDNFEIIHVKREKNTEADALVNVILGKK